MTGSPGPDLSPAERVRRAAVTLAALSQGGLEYGVSEYDLDRYRKVGALAADLLAAVTDRPAEDWRVDLGRDSVRARASPPARPANPTPWRRWRSGGSLSTCCRSSHRDGSPHGSWSG